MEEQTEHYQSSYEKKMTEFLKCEQEKHLLIQQNTSLNTQLISAKEQIEKKTQTLKEENGRMKRVFEKTIQKNVSEITELQQTKDEQDKKVQELLKKKIVSDKVIKLTQRIQDKDKLIKSLVTTKDHNEETINQLRKSQLTHQHKITRFQQSLKELKADNEEKDKRLSDYEAVIFELKSSLE